MCSEQAHPRLTQPVGILPATIGIVAMDPGYWLFCLRHHAAHHRQDTRELAVARIHILWRTDGCGLRTAITSERNAHPGW